MPKFTVRWLENMSPQHNFAEWVKYAQTDMRSRQMPTSDDRAALAMACLDPINRARTWRRWKCDGPYSDDTLEFLRVNCGFRQEQA